MDEACLPGRAVASSGAASSRVARGETLVHVESRFATVHIDAIEPIRARGQDWLPVRRLLGIQAFGVNAFVVPEAGETVIGEHVEPDGQEEVYVVLRGHATFRIEEDEVDAPAGTFVFVRDPQSRRRAVAQEAGTTVLVVGGHPGKPFEIGEWEAWLPAYPYYVERDYERAIELGTEALAEHPENATLLYNLACSEALAGRRDEAVGHLRRAVALEPDLREHAVEDDDLAAVRDAI
jgi:mannose-6-phosphate isomerase-like protein (cupin superfamily)